MICPACNLDQQRIRLDQHLREDHHWPADRAETYYQQQIDKWNAPDMLHVALRHYNEEHNDLTEETVEVLVSEVQP